MEGIGNIIAKHHKIILLISIILLIPSAIGAISTSINYDILSYLPQNLNSTKAQKVLNEDFSDTGATVVMVEGMEEKEVVKLKNKIMEIDGIANVSWVDDLADISVPKEMLPADVKNRFYSGDTTALYISFKDSGITDRTLNSIEEIRELGGDKVHVAGMVSIVKDTKDVSDKETPIFIGVAVILCIAILALTMKSTFIPVFFMIGIGFAIAYNMGTNVFFGEISYVTSSLSAVLQLGVTMDFSIFLLHRYEEEKLNVKDKYEAMAHAINMTLSSIAGSSLTTIAGFLALGVMELTLGKDIGLVMAKGVAFGVITTVTVLPALILQFDNLIHKYSHKVLLPKFEKVSQLVVKRRIIIFIIFLIMFLPAVYGNTHTNVYYNMIKTLPENMKSIVSTNKLKKDYNMTTTHFILVNEKLETYQIKEIIDQIEELDGIEGVLAAESILGENIPVSFIPDDVMKLVEGGGYKLILVNSAFAAGEDEENEQIDSIDSIVKKYDEKYLLGGEGPLTKDLIQVADSDFKRVSVVSIIVIFIIILIVFKSFFIPILLVLAIEFAIFINMGIPAFTGTEIPFISSIVIGCIQLGATVDYAILLTSRFKEELSKIGDKSKAMQIALRESASSIVTSGLTFFGATFGVSMISSLEIVKSLCGLISRGAIISMCVIIFVLPTFLLIFEGVISKTTIKWRTN